MVIIHTYDKMVIECHKKRKHGNPEIKKVNFNLIDGLGI